MSADNVSPLGRRIASLTRETTVTYEVDLTRGEALDLLIDHGADENIVTDLSDADLVALMLDPDADHFNDVSANLNDYSSEVDSGDGPWVWDEAPKKLWRIDDDAEDTVSVVRAATAEEAIAIYTPDGNLRVEEADQGDVDNYGILNDYTDTDRTGK